MTDVDTTDRPEPTTSSDGDGQLPVTVYWRPGCPFCTVLRRGLERAGVVFEQIDIWEEPDAAAFVRSVADGCETVPTVTIGDTALVNPPAALVAELAFRAG